LRQLAPVELQQVLVDLARHRLRHLGVERLAQPAEKARRGGDAQLAVAVLAMRLGEPLGDAAREQLGLVVELVFAGRAGDAAAAAAVGIAARWRRAAGR
jgi:hypothetical protein